MGRVCTVCAHSAVEKINRALIAGAESQRSLAQRYGLSQHSMGRHYRNHLPAVMLQGQAEQEQTAAEDLAAHLEDLRSQTQEIKALALQAGDLRCGLQAIRELARLLELQLRWRGMLRDDAPSSPVSIYLPALSDAELDQIIGVSGGRSPTDHPPAEGARADAVAPLPERARQAEEKERVTQAMAHQEQGRLTKRVRELERDLSWQKTRADRLQAEARRDKVRFVDG